MTDSGSEGAKHKCVKGINEIGTAWCTTHDQNWIHKDCEESAASNTGKLMPCPFCGGEAVQGQNRAWCGNFIPCPVSIIMDDDDQRSIPVDIWNNACAHKQIASLTERVKELEYAISSWKKEEESWISKLFAIQSQLDAANKRNELLEKEIKEQRVIELKNWNQAQDDKKALTRQLDKHGKALKRVVTEVFNCKVFDNCCVCNAKKVLQSAAEIRDGKVQ